MVTVETRAILSDPFTNDHVQLDLGYFNTNWLVLLKQAKANEKNWKNKDTLSKIIYTTLQNCDVNSTDYLLSYFMTDDTIKSFVEVLTNWKKWIPNDTATIDERVLHLFHDMGNRELKAINALVLMAIANFEGEPY